MAQNERERAEALGNAWSRIAESAEELQELAGDATPIDLQELATVARSEAGRWWTYFNRLERNQRRDELRRQLEALGEDDDTPNS